MRPYEMMVLVSAELEDPKEEIAKVEEVVRSLEGEIVKTDFWGKRRLAYPIDKKTEGFYALCSFKLKPDQLEELHRVLGLRPNIYRQMTIRLDEK
ncbi:MAG: 30S ribosomal protein S6 [Synergistetes bacterium HGW-Synergistetes-2]|nr:MAG: 30S ribosomal protein S6 [Synergistetes bacterium HGW-Synergistetes-2]